MKENLKELTKEEILKLEPGTKYFVYNPFSKNFRMEIVGKNDIAHNKYAVEKLRYYVEKQDV